MEEKEQAYEDLQVCISSGASFNSNFKTLLTNLYSHPHGTAIDNYLDAIAKLLNDPDTLAPSKFYCLLILLKITESENEGLDQFITSLSKYKTILNKLFQDAQFDKERPIHERGNRFFSKQPTFEEIIVGNNFIRLTLEIIHFWSETYGSTTKKESGHIFYVMFTSLSKMFKFPDSYNYVCSSSAITNDFHLRQDFSHEGKTVDQAAINIKAFMQISSCISSGTEYKLNSKVVFDSILENSSLFGESFLDTIAEILDSKEYAPKAKFYALYLLTQVTEKKNKVFMTCFAQRKNMLTKFAQVVLSDATGKERGGRLFPEIINTPDAIIGKNFIMLLIEAIKFWDENFGSDDINSPFHAFRTLDSSIWEFVRVPKDYFYVGQNLNPEDGLMGKSLSVIEFLPMILEEPLSTHDHMESLDPKLAIEHVHLCVTSSEAFNDNIHHVVGAIEQNSQAYLENFVQTIYEITSSGEHRPLSRFYALYLLAKVVELDNEALIFALEQDQYILNKLEVYAQTDKSQDYYERGITFFSKNPSSQDSILGNCFLCLVLELLIFLSQTHGSENEGNSGHIFHSIVSTLLRNKVQFPQKFVFMKRQMRTVLAELDEKLHYSHEHGSDRKAPKNEVIPQNDRKKNGHGNGNGHGHSQQRSKEKVQEPGNEAVDSWFRRLEILKEELRLVLENHDEGSIKLKKQLDAIIGELNTGLSKDLNPHIKGLMAQNELEDQKIISRIYTEGELASFVNNEYTQYKNETSSYDVFRNGVLKALRNKLAFQQPEENHRNPEPENKDNPAQERGDREFFRDYRPEYESERHNNNEVQKKKEVKESVMRNSITKESPVRKLNISAQGFGTPMGVNKKIPEDQLMSSLREIERSIQLTSKSRTSDLDQIENAIKKSYSRSGRRPPLVEPLDELKRKERLEQEVTRLKREKLNLSSSFIKNQNMLDSPGSPGNDSRGEEEGSRGLRTSQIKRSPRREQIKRANSKQKEYENLLEDLQKKVEQANQELQRKNYELENLKKIRQGANGEVVEKVRDENESLKRMVQERKGQLQLSRRTPNRRRDQGKEKLVVENTDMIYGTSPESEKRSSREGIQQRSGLERREERQDFFLKETSQKEKEGSRFKGEPIMTAQFKQEERPITNGAYASPDGGKSVGEMDEQFETPRSQLSKNNLDTGSEMDYLMTAKPGEITEAGGEIIEHNSPFLQALRNELGNSPNQTDILNFKLNNLRSKYVLYEDEFLQIGATSVLLTDHSLQRRLLKTVLYYANHNNFNIDDFSIGVVSEEGLANVLRPETLHTTVEPGKQTKQQIISLVQKIPFECPVLSGNFAFRSDYIQFSLYLPTLVTKFMEFKPIELESFERRWKMGAGDVLRSGTVLLDPNLVKSGYDFKKFFQYLLDLTLMDEYDYIQGRKSIDLGGAFELDLLGVEYLLKISVLPSKKAVFQILSADKKDYEVAKFILETLAFLFHA